MKTLAIVCIVLMSNLCTSQNTKFKLEKNKDLIEAWYFHDNGEIAQTGFYKNGKLTGQWTMYSEEGKRLTLGTYRNGRRVGKWLFWHLQNDVLTEVHYLNGKPKVVTLWKKTDKSLRPDL
ncbi:MAG: nicotinic acid mononucleotide adenyltransferase [Bacteroidota bacterium]